LTTTNAADPSALSFPDAAFLDSDVLMGHYPFRQFPYDNRDPARLKHYLQSKGIARACVSSLHALFYTDPQQGNDEHLSIVAGDDFFIPVAVVNPSLPNWRRGLEKSRQRYGVTMVRLTPSYHVYDLAAPLALECVQELASQGLLVSIVKRIEDERMHHPPMKVAAVANGSILAAAAAVDHPLLIQGAYLGELSELATAPNLRFDIAFVETIDTLARATQIVPPSRLLFSSHAPFFYPEAAISKVQLWQTSAANHAQVASENFTELLGVSLAR
jgi:predicted TIM-barrel fold metal-dependent hydrolase